MPKGKLDQLTEVMYYTLIALKEPRCGIEITEFIAAITHQRVNLGPGTLYTMLSKFLEEHMIEEVPVPGRKRIYVINEKGKDMLKEEAKRLQKMLDEGPPLSGGFMKREVVNLNSHLFECEQLCTYFHDMALQGWMLTNIKYTWLVFTKAAPQDVAFVIDIYSKGSYLNPYNIDKEQITYSEFIEAYGYERIALTGNYHVYRMKKETVPIHSEESADQQEERRKTILKYEGYTFICFNTGLAISDQPCISL